MANSCLHKAPTQLAAGRFLQRLSANPWTLLVALLLVNALFRPYAGLVHDARLYGIQVLDRIEPRTHADDLYLCYGSQDAYSAFSRFAAPLVQAIGLPGAFFLLYLGSNAVFFFGLQRLVQALVKPRSMAILALIYLAVNPVPFGGLSVFHVHESFLTPRLFANGLVLLALERLVRKHTWVSLALLVGAMLLHPLMACSGVLVWIAWNVLAHLTPRAIVVLAVSCAFGVTFVLACWPLGIALFGHMDTAWRDAAYAANFYSLPEEWPLGDWLRIGVAFAVLAGARWLAAPSARVRRLVDSILIVAAVGIVVSCLAPHLPYKLLVQGQPYRALWLLQLMQVPLLFTLIGRFRSRGPPRARLAAMMLVLAFCYATMTGPQILAATLLVFLANAWRRTTAPAPAPVWLRLITALGIITVASRTIAASLHAWREFAALLPPVERIQTIPLTIGPFLTWLTALGALVIMARLLGTGNRFRGAALAGWLMMQTACFAIPESPLYRWMGVQRSSDISFIEQFLRERRDAYAGLPTVYCPAANLEDIWFALRAKSFFVTQQVAGNMFHRGTAIEGDRRARVVAHFDLNAWRTSRFSIADWKRRSLERVYGRDLESASPTLEDLYQLCCEDIDVAILPQKFEGWFSSTNGRWFIYDCRAIRDSLAENRTHTGDVGKRPTQSEPTPAAGADHSKSDDTHVIFSPQPAPEDAISSPAAP